jgi:hypothetical protein
MSTAREKQEAKVVEKQRVLGRRRDEGKGYGY